MFDVLGFKELVKSTPLPELAGRYRRVVEQAAAFNRPLFENEAESMFRMHPANKPWCIQHVFSDSVILIADESSAESTLRLLVYSWRLFQFFLAMGFPLRGGIAHGEMFVDPTARIFLGKALVDAYELEASQAWVGAAIHESVVAAHPSLAADLDSPDSLLGEVFRRYEVPLKNGTSMSLRTLNWRLNLIVKKGTRSLLPLCEGPGAHQYQVNALKYARVVVESGRVYPSDAPIELRRLWVGDTPPSDTFTHGDDL